MRASVFIHICRGDHWSSVSPSPLGKGDRLRWMRLFLTQHIATSSDLLRNPPSPKGKVRREINPRPTYHLRLGEDFTAKRFHMIYHISLIEDEFHCGASRHLPRPTIINGNCYRNLRVTRRTTNGRPYDQRLARCISSSRRLVYHQFHWNCISSRLCLAYLRP